MALQHSKWAPLISPFVLTPQTIPRIDNTSTANDVTYIIRGLKVVKQQAVSISIVSIVWLFLLINRCTRLLLFCATSLLCH
jgi:hypothetical protein